MTSLRQSSNWQVPMPFVKRDITAPPSAGERSQEELEPHFVALGSPDADTRWTAARALGGRGDAVAALGSALAAEQVPRVREAIMTALMRTGDEASVSVLLPYLRAQDADQRTAAL